MKTRLRSLTRVVALTALVAALGAGPAAATESADVGDEGGKLTLPESSHDRAGLIFLGLTGLATLAAGANAVKQYRGERPQADGSIRWR